MVEAGGGESKQLVDKRLADAGHPSSHPYTREAWHPNCVWLGELDEAVESEGALLQEGTAGTLMQWPLQDNAWTTTDTFLASTGPPFHSYKRQANIRLPNTLLTRLASN